MHANRTCKRDLKKHLRFIHIEIYTNDLLMWGSNFQPLRTLSRHKVPSARPSGERRPLAVLLNIKTPLNGVDPKVSPRYSVVSNSG